MVVGGKEKEKEIEKQRSYILARGGVLLGNWLLEGNEHIL